MSYWIPTTRQLCSAILFLIALSGCGGGGGGGSPGTTTAPTITGFYYSFDDNGATIVDHSGNNFHGKPTALATVAGKVGSAVQFLGVGSEIGLPSLNYFPYEKGFSFMAWVKTSHPITAREQLFGGWTGGQPGAFYPISNIGISLVDGKISFETTASPGMLSFTTSPLPIVNDQ